MTFYYLAVWQVLNNPPNAQVYKLEKTRDAYHKVLERTGKLVYYKERRISL